jgi:hypothetical protein
MIEQDYLKYCLSEIEEKLNWEPSQNWKESDYLKLSQTISETSNISISAHTLKRLFGKIKYKEFYNPQQATKDALSKYLSYDDWLDFVEKTKHNLNEKKQSEDVFVKKGKSKKLLLGLVFTFVIGLLLFVFVKGEGKERNKIEVFEFNLLESTGVVPFTVPINYNISGINSDDIQVDFDFKHPFRGNQIVNPDKNGSVLNFTYQIPGYYHIVLKIEQDTLAVKNILAMSEEWDSYFVGEYKLGKFWMDNEIKQSRDSLGYLYFPPSKLNKQGFDSSKVYYINNRLFKEFEIDGDNFEFNTKFKNTKNLGGITCYDFIMRLVCENNTNFINLVEEGCSQYSAIRFGEIQLNGERQNLSDFKVDIKNWNTLHIIVREKQVEVFINDELIYKEKYQESNGEIVGVENVFKGSGLLDYIKIKDLNSGKTFIENFDLK